HTSKRKPKPLLRLEDARANRERVPFDDLPRPPSLGVHTLEPPLETLVPYIDWQFFFHAWELKGKFPAILEQPAARELYDGAQELPRELATAASLHARRGYGCAPATR